MRRVDAALLVQPGLLRDQLGGEQPVDLVPGRGDLGGDGVAEHLCDRAQQVVTDDRVLLGADPERDVLVRDPLHHVVKGRGIGIDELHGIGHDRARERAALLSGGLVALVEQL